MTCVECGKQAPYKDEKTITLRDRLCQIGQYVPQGANTIAFFGIVYLCAQMYEMSHLLGVSIFRQNPYDP